MKLNDTFLDQMREATELLRTSGPAAATAAIQRALSGAAAPSNDPASQGDIVDINPITTDTPDASSDSPRGHFVKRFLSGLRMPRANPLMRQPFQDVEFNDAAQPAAQPGGRGQFLSGSCTNHAGTRAYKLYVPSTYQGEPLPLVVMLHGCKQNPDDFAAGTGINRLADQHDCLVVYPAQAVKANGSNCWNWFNPQDQDRDRGEPSLIADMTRQVMREYKIDPDRVYVAGLSAGGAMASILAAKYPDLYAAVAVHSGLPVGAAHDLPSAFGAMKQSKPAHLSMYRQPVPAIVFHGDRDHTVHPGNSSEVIAQCMGVPVEGKQARQVKTSKVNGKAANGRTYTQTIFFNHEERAIAEHWVIHGSGHAWSGGSKAGSYTDPKGPDASSEMIRFFYTHRRQSRA